jgi:hypothetical protein
LLQGGLLLGPCSCCLRHCMYLLLLLLLLLMMFAAWAEALATQLLLV